MVCFTALVKELKRLEPGAEVEDGTCEGCCCFLSMAGDTGELVELSGR